MKQPVDYPVRGNEKTCYWCDNEVCTCLMIDGDKCFCGIKCYMAWKKSNESLSTTLIFTAGMVVGAMVLAVGFMVAMAVS